MASFEAVIGLEIHAQLLTDTKIFCGCSAAFGAAPNTNICPVCIGLPGALPVLNRRAVDFAVRASLALGCAINERSIFARKNYFYPDLPKGYQISQYEQPLATGGRLLGVNDGNMEEGSLRCDANVSVRPAGAVTLGTKAEVKNLNSFRFLQKALEYEIDRQIGVVSDGGRVVQETRLWDAAAARTVSMRSKEEAHDYRYFPDPDLPPLVVDAARVDAIRQQMPELPSERRARFVSAYALPEYDARQLTQSRALADHFEATVAAGAPAKAASNWAMQHGAALAPTALASLIALVEQGAISTSVAKGVFEQMVATGRSAQDIVAAEGLSQISDDATIDKLIADVLARNDDAVAQYRAGKTATFGFLVGQVMKAAGGKANPKRINERLKEALGA